MPSRRTASWLVASCLFGLLGLFVMRAERMAALSDPPGVFPIYIPLVAVNADLTLPPTMTATATATSTKPARTPLPTRSHTPSPTQTLSPTPSLTPSPTASRTPSSSPTPTPTLTPQPTPTPSATLTSTATPSTSPTSSATASHTPSSSPTPTSTLTPQPSPSASATLTSTATPSASPTASPTSSRTPSLTPSATPSPTFTLHPTSSHTPSPTGLPSSTATVTPTSTNTPASSYEEALAIAWLVKNPGPGTQTHPALAYNPATKRLLLAWEDGRHDPEQRVDTYGFNNNSDIFARRYNDNGTPYGDEITIARDGEYLDSGRYDNEQWPAVSLANGDFEISWMTISDDALEMGDLRTSNCYNVDARSFTDASHALGPVTEDLADYDAPADLVDPWGNLYNWSCQQEPELVAIDAGLFLHVWQDHRERFSDAGGKWVSKDIYAQIRDHGQLKIHQALLVSHDEQNRRLPFHQENSDVAGENNQYLVVWEDERNTSELYPEGSGYRDIYGRFLHWRDGILTTGAEVEIASGLEGDYLVSNPRVGYLSARGQYIVLWSRQGNDSVLQYAVFNPDGTSVIGPITIPNTEAEIRQVYDIACADHHCLIIYRKGSDTLNMYANSLSDHDYLFDNEIRLDDFAGHHSYPKIQVGEVGEVVTGFYFAYAVSQRVILGRIDIQPTESSTWRGKTLEIDASQAPLLQGAIPVSVIK